MGGPIVSPRAARFCGDPTYGDDAWLDGPGDEGSEPLRLDPQRLATGRGQPVLAATFVTARFVTGYFMRGSGHG